MDGSVSDTSCGVAALYFHGKERHVRIYAVHFSRQHSSTHGELVALRLACCQTEEFNHTKCITFISDLMRALQGICQQNGALGLMVTARATLIDLHNHIETLRLWWILAHVGLEEHDQVDYSAKRAADGCDPTPNILVPFSHTSLKGIAHQYYNRLQNTRWTTHSHDCHLLPLYDPSLSWTESLPKKTVTLTAQFLSGHFISNAYLHRFHLRESGRCIWCDHPICDRIHILLDCPRFEHPWQQLFNEARLNFLPLSSQLRDLLSVFNKSHLARFLLIVDRTRRSTSE